MPYEAETSMKGTYDAPQFFCPLVDNSAEKVQADTRKTPS